MTKMYHGTSKENLEKIQIEKIREEFILKHGRGFLQKSGKKFTEELKFTGLRKALALSGVSQSELAKQIGVREATVTEWVNKKSEMKLYNLRQISEYLTEVSDLDKQEITSIILETDNA